MTRLRVGRNKLRLAEHECPVQGMPVLKAYSRI